MPLHRYTHAVLCRIPNSIVNINANVDVEKARSQHLALAQLLRELGIDVVEMPADESAPMCAFVEDIAVLCNGIALIARPAEASRMKEIEVMRAVLKKELEISLVEITDTSAKLDGGDVLFTGREFFVGLSQFTNEKGARAVAAAFPEYPCVPIKVPENKRLKGLLTMASPDVICVGAGIESQQVLKRIEREATYVYTTLTVPEDVAANVIFINGTLIRRHEDEIPLSNDTFSTKLDIPTRELHMSELAKVSLGLTSCCLLVRKPRHIRSL
ncbi:N(G),N(G)-dimethylarginine dimethylaminohydrolase 1 [Chelonus insularis]|uniref:N(G),N(G)-dimethylarginine dimethylaminohydrolase 1 n=1 Tax=Chelonus insularis TaxID=460826 RepID=UPI00158A128C|nr:N(G),N(G)-dimethylarginine dimethylaminohydrolase 1 [Chelonus insularis]